MAKTYEYYKDIHDNHELHVGSFCVIYPSTIKS